MTNEIKRTRTSKTNLAAMGIALAAISVGTLMSSIPANAEKSASSKFASVDLGWPSDLNKALTEAKARKKYVLADFYTNWCLWCKKLEADTFADPDTATYLKKKFLTVRVNAEGTKAEQAAAEKYKVFTFPCVLVFDNKGKFIGKINKYYGPKEFQDVVEDLIKNPPSDPYAD